MPPAAPLPPAPSLPIDAILPQVVAAVRDTGRVVIEAPPGAGKTTRVPLALLDAVPGRLVMLEPRRLAARAAAERMAATLGEPAGATVGYRMRGATRVSPATRIEVVTEGILTRMLQDDPSLGGIGAVIFDEIHERSLNADLGLALCLEVRQALRPDLVLIAMSATLDAGAVARAMEAVGIRAEGRAFPVETRWADRPPDRNRIEPVVADAVLSALAETEGGVLVFLPGAAEIGRTGRLLEGRLPPGCALHPLYGALPFAAQQAAVAPGDGVRKIVLATAIAETSLTIEGIRVVVDAGLARRARFDPGSGMARLVTERASRAEADQRRGRAGRVAPGLCLRLWTQGEEGGMPMQAPPEIETADLSRLALDLASWGARDPAELAFLTPPPPGPFAAARRLLTQIGALDAEGAITPAGRAMADLPLHPRLAHAAVVAGAGAAPLAALLSEPDPASRSGVDLGARLRRIETDRDFAPVRALARRLTRRLTRGLPPHRDLSPGQMAALAYPDRIALRRPGAAPRWLLSGGSGAAMNPDDALSGARLLVVTDTDGRTPEATIRRAIEITEAELREVAADAIAWDRTCVWSRRDRKVLARRVERLGALVLDDRPWPDVPADAVARALLDGLREIGLPWSDAARRFAGRVAMLREAGAALPEMTEAALLDAPDWLVPYLAGCTTADDLRRIDLATALAARLTWEQRDLLDRDAPAAFRTPLGRSVPIDYSDGVPAVTVRLQELFGLRDHPVVAARPLKITLLSPAGRPLQVTTDLPGFWARSYADVRRDMRGRYPRHPWPEDPALAEPTLRAKPRS